AMEAIKLLLGLGEPLTGRLLIYDALEEDFSSVSIDRDPNCPACADPNRPPKIVEYDQTCRPAGNVARAASS
ncbi:MAG: adenylyltransferase/sulfurtransferase MoeZ, partial [Acidimicrobiia bacterium]